MSDSDESKPMDDSVTSIAERIVGDMEPIIHEVIKKLKLGGLYQSNRNVVESAFSSRLKIIANPESAFWLNVAEFRATSTSEAQFWARLRGYYRRAVERSVLERLSHLSGKTLPFSQLTDGQESSGPSVEASIVERHRSKPIQTPDDLNLVDDNQNRVFFQLLTSHEREWLVDRFVNDLSIREIAEAEGKTEETMRRKINRAVNKFRDRLGQQVNGDRADDEQE